MQDSNQTLDSIEQFQQYQTWQWHLEDFKKDLRELMLSQGELMSKKQKSQFFRLWHMRTIEYQMLEIIMVKDFQSFYYMRTYKYQHLLYLLGGIYKMQRAQGQRKNFKLFIKNLVELVKRIFLVNSNPSLCPGVELAQVEIRKVWIMKAIVQVLEKLSKQFGQKRKEKQARKKKEESALFRNLGLKQQGDYHDKTRIQKAKKVITNVLDAISAILKQNNKDSDPDEYERIVTKNSKTQQKVFNSSKNNRSNSLVVKRLKEKHRNMMPSNSSQIHKNKQTFSVSKKYRTESIIKRSPSIPSKATQNKQKFIQRHFNERK